MMMPEDFPEWRFTFGFGSEIVCLPFADLLTVDQSIATIKAVDGNRILFATGKDHKEAWERLMDGL